MTKFYIPWRRVRIWRRKHSKMICLIAGVITGLILGFSIISMYKTPEVISPIPEVTSSPEPELIKTEKVEPTTSPNAPQSKINGKASWYSVSGCIGCHPERVMANGQRLDDTRATVAYNHLPLNTSVKITNTVNGKTITVPVTDRGGFERHGKIADLSLATKNAIGCGDVCNITIEK